MCGSGSQAVVRMPLVVRESFLSGMRRYRRTVFVKPSDRDVTITLAVHFVFKLIGCNYTSVSLRHKYTIKKMIAFLCACQINCARRKVNANLSVS